MDRKDLSKRILILIFLLFIFNFIAGKFFWYYSIWYFDMIMHFTGGFFLGLSMFWLFWPAKLLLKSSLKILFGVLLIGVAWELFELFFINYVAGNSFDAIDTLSDLFFDLAGGSMSLYYCHRKIVSINETTV